VLVQLGGLDEHPPFGIPSPCGAGRIEIHVDSDELRGRVRERFRAWADSGITGLTVATQQPEAMELMADLAGTRGAGAGTPPA